jgi:long-chain acyl-CoA synthetase
MENNHFANLLQSQATKFSDKVAIYDREHLTDAWQAYTWTQMQAQVDMAALALLELGVNVADRVGQFTQNKAQCLIVDYALFSVRAAVVPMYATSTEQQVSFIVDDAEIQIVFVGDQSQYNIAVDVALKSKSLKTIVSFDSKVILSDKVNSMHFEAFLDLGRQSSKKTVLDSLRQAAQNDDMACLLYTSGTTGNPKGVVMLHSCFNEGMVIHKERLTSVSENDISIAFLPLSHVFERTWCYFCMYMGVAVYINHRPIEIQQTIKDVRPTLMCAVPRFWEKVYAGVQDNIAKMSPFKKGMVTWALEVGRLHNMDYLRLDKSPGKLLSIKYKIADKLIFSKVKKTIGLENANILPTAGAKLSDDINIFMQSMGVPIFYGYGLTESTATVSCYTYKHYQMGSVGKVMPGVSVKIGEDNEILLKGKTIFPGYYKNEEANKAAFTEDGWFKTGDAGLFKDNVLTLTERIKDLFKTSNGKYIAPQAIETRLALDPYIEQIAAIGDERNYVTAIIAPSISAIEEYAAKHDIKYNGVEELIQHEAIISLIDSRIKAGQVGMAPYEQIKKFTLIKKGFSIESGELTNTLKMRRAVIMQKYKAQIEQMYVV